MSEQPALQERVAAIDRAVANQESAISRHRTFKILAVLIILLGIVLAALPFVKLVKGVKKNTDAYVAELQNLLQDKRPSFEQDFKNIAEDVREPLTEAVRRVVNESREPLMKALNHAVDTYSPKLATAASNEGRTLVDNTVTKVKGIAQERLTKAVEDQNVQFAKVFQDKRKLEACVDNFRAAFTKVGDELIGEPYKAAIQRLRKTWDEFPMQQVKPAEEKAVPDIIRSMFVEMLIEKFTGPARRSVMRGELRAAPPKEVQPVPRPAPGAEHRTPPPQRKRPKQVKPVRRPAPGAERRAVPPRPKRPAVRRAPTTRPGARAAPRPRRVKPVPRPPAGQERGFKPKKRPAGKRGPTTKPARP